MPRRLLSSLPWKRATMESVEIQANRSLRVSHEAFSKLAARVSFSDGVKPQDGDAFGSAEVRGGEQSIKAPLVCVMTSVPQRATAKYGARGYRMALLEAGHASQNLCLAAQGLGMDRWSTAPTMTMNWRRCSISTA